LSSHPAQSHHTLTPPTLLLPLEKTNVSELTVSFTSGQWHQLRHGESGPLTYEAGGGGGEARGWIAGDEKEANKAWDDVTHAMAGLFCATVGTEDMGENVRTFGGLYPPARDGEGTLIDFV
jgi:phosphatidylinositol glycan class T